MRKKIKILFISILCVVLLTACGTANTGVSAASVDVEATPKTDFYAYINKQWLKETKLKENESMVDNLSQLTDKTNDSIRQMVEQLDADYDSLKAGSDEKKLIDFYRLAKDFEMRNTLGLNPIKPYLDDIKKTSSIDELSKLTVAMYGKNVHTLFKMSVSQDFKNSAKNSLYIDPQELSFSKENFEGTDEFSVKKQQAFKEYLSEVFVLAGDVPEVASQKAKLLFELEREMASVQRPKEDLNDFEGKYNLKSWDEVKALAPRLPILETAKLLNASNEQSVIVTEPEALVKASELYEGKNLEALKAQLQYHLIEKYAEYLSEDLIKARAKYDGVSNGAVEIPTQEEVAFSAIETNFSDMIGKVYVKNHFSEESKADILAMVDELKATYAKRIKATDWMSEETKLRALKKLDTMIVKIGYPDKWEDYSKLNIKSKVDGGTLFSNVEEIQTLNLQKEFANLGKPVDKTTFGMPAYMVNAYYSPSNNEIVFPAGILQAPFYDPDADPEVNLGGIGAVIGHEISHAFDKAGSQFDENGNLVNWWKQEDLDKFQKKVQQAADIYSKLEVAPGYYVNGEISTGEIIADLGGLTVALDIAKQKGYDTKKVFEAYGKVWREVSTEEFAIENITDEHPPAKYRVNNIINQLDEFYKDFDVKEGDPMYVKPEERLRVW